MSMLHGGTKSKPCVANLASICVIRTTYPEATYLRQATSRPVGVLHIVRLSDSTLSCPSGMIRTGAMIVPRRSDCLDIQYSQH